MLTKEQLLRAEIREDYIHDRFVIVAPGRGGRPFETREDEGDKIDFKREQRECVFCPGQQKGVRSKFLAGSEDNWSVKVVDNIFPAISMLNEKVYGYQEIVIETPDHRVDLGELPVDHIIEIFESYIARTKELSKDKRIEYILIFKNKGGKAGASLKHAHSQIFAAGFTPPHIVHKLTRAQEYRIEHGNCYYCELLKKEAKGERQIMSDERAVAFAPYASNYQYEAWVIPQKHLDNITVLDREEIASIAGMYKHIAAKLNGQNIPYNMYLHQSIKDRDEHFYMRVCPRRSVWAGVELGSRIIINTVSPEDAAAFYRR